MNDNFDSLKRDDVVSVYSDHILVTNRTFTISEFIAAMMTLIKEQKNQGEWTELKEMWFREGIDCKILKPGAKSWQRGKVRITLEFQPEELEVAEVTEIGKSADTKVVSPLDDLRQKMPKES
ncbi:KGK family protein [Oscillatoria nigro-viridis PCC 7112]|uniref:KGK family protein n=1 Tax=Phormidium nigroviride PCC 7112 TaxID=179408 RepID=K9VSB0_9CYAN|nr:KGK domain-containing protein [Oscillatoria nigro-viridis]AFZ10085.1 KGK family protein [Oscillatoria nigro-viridis PCC 7112]